MRLLFGHTHRGQSVENRLALDLQFARQIIDSNFTHPSPIRYPLQTQPFIRSLNPSGCLKPSTLNLTAVRRMPNGVHSLTTVAAIFVALVVNRLVRDILRLRYQRVHAVVVELNLFFPGICI